MLRPLGIEYIPRLAAGFLKANPGQDIQFTFHTGVTQYLLDGLAARKYDLVFCSQPSEEHKFTAVPIQKQNLILITPQSHPLSAKDSVDLVETIPYPQIFFEKSAGIRNVIDQMFARTGASPKIAYETEEDQVIAGLVAQGFGIAVAPYMDILQKIQEALQLYFPENGCSGWRRRRNGSDSLMSMDIPVSCRLLIENYVMHVLLFISVAQIMWKKQQRLKRN